MSYQSISTSLTTAGKAAVRQIFSLIASNFSDHQARLNDLENFVTPIATGTITRYPAGSVPTGFLTCDGAAVSRATYQELFSKIGTTYGSGDGSTTFNVPDCRGKVSIGAGQGVGLTNRVVATTVGANTHSLNNNEMPSHTHAKLGDSHSHTFSDTGDNASINNGLRLVTANAGALFGGDAPVQTVTTGILTQTQGSGTAHNNMQPYVVVQMVIKT